MTTPHLLKTVALERSNPNKVSVTVLKFIAKSGMEANTGKYSPSIQGGTSNNLGGLPMKLAEMRGENDVDSDQEERMGLMQDRLRLKKNISANGNYTLTKVPAAGQPGANNAQAQGQDDKGDGKDRARSVGGPKPNIQTTMEKMKKNNLTASNPIIGAPLANQIAKRTDKTLPAMNLKGKEGTVGGKPTTASQTIKPALANAKIPKYIKKTLKFA